MNAVNELAIDDKTQLWLRLHLPNAERPYLLWRSNQVCVEIAKRQAQVMPERHGTGLIRANQDARHMSALIYLSHIGAAQDHAKLALDVTDLKPEHAERIHGRIAKLEELAREPMAEVTP
jgi:hypothetical protein